MTRAADDPYGAVENYDGARVCCPTAWRFGIEARLCGEFASATRRGLAVPSLGRASTTGPVTFGWPRPVHSRLSLAALLHWILSCSQIGRPRYTIIVLARLRAGGEGSSRANSNMTED